MVQLSPAEIPDPTTKLVTMIVLVCESIALYLIAEPPHLSNPNRGGCYVAALSRTDDLGESCVFTVFWTLPA
jgi:hypothetical protein